MRCCRCEHLFEADEEATCDTCVEGECVEAAAAGASEVEDGLTNVPLYIREQATREKLLGRLDAAACESLMDLASRIEDGLA